ncbi:MAG: response regulator transcription factor [Synechococcus sp.]
MAPSPSPTEGPSRVLVVDDDPELRQFLQQELSADGHHCEEAASAAQALNRIRAEAWDLVLLDWTLPDFSGVDLCRRMRQDRDGTPVLMLTAHDDVAERVQALDAGADDYLTKPFSIEELLARVRAHLRRAGQNLSEVGGALRLADLEVQPASREVSRAGVPISLTGKEFDLLHLLISRPDQVHQRCSIMESVWGATWVGDDNVLDVYIRALRRKIERPGSPTLLQTVRGVGFMLKVGDLKV